MGECVCIGIDLGTTYFRVGVYRNGRFEIIRNLLNERQTPCYVTFKDEDCVVGELSKKDVSDNVENTIFYASRLIGCTYKEACEQTTRNHWPFTFVDDKDRPKIKVAYKQREASIFPVEVSARILSGAKEMAEQYLGHVVTHAVITVPACFKPSQRAATILAGNLAGLTVHTLNEPEAAAVAYVLENKETLQQIQNVMVFRMGGGSFDVSIFAINNYDETTLKTIHTTGVHDLGGLDFDSAVVECLTQVIKEEHLSVSPLDIYHFHQRCEHAKKSMVSCNDTNIPYMSLVKGIPRLNAIITRDGFQNIQKVKTLLSTIKDTVTSSMGKAGCKIDKLIMVGGSSRTEGVSKAVIECFDGSIQPDYTVDIDEAAIRGAAYRASQLQTFQQGENDISSSLEDTKLSEDEFKFLTEKSQKWYTKKEREQIRKNDINQWIKSLSTMQRELKKADSSDKQRQLLQRCAEITKLLRSNGKHSVPTDEMYNTLSNLQIDFQVYLKVS